MKSTIYQIPLTRDIQNTTARRVALLEEINHETGKIRKKYLPKTGF